MKKMNKVLVTLLALAMLVALVGCQNTQEPDQPQSSETVTTEKNTEQKVDSTETAPPESITLTIWNTEAPVPGIQTNEVALEIERILNTKMDIIQGDAQKFSILVAGGDLPDIIYSNPAQQGVDSNTLISSGNIIALDELIEEYAPNIKANFPSRLEFSKQFASNGEDKVYFLPVLAYEADPSNPDISYSIANVGIMTRWDVYSAIGYPEINTTDDYLNVLKQMQDYARENDLANGKEIYAISGWSDWGLWPWVLANMREMGYDDKLNNVYLDRETDEASLAYLTDAFWDSLKFFNKAYNMGIVDPEAFTMKNDQFWGKCINGQVLMAHASWQTENINKSMVSAGNAQWGFEKLPYDGYKYISGIVAPNQPLGSGVDYANAITKNCLDPVRAIQLLDFLNTEEGARLVLSGIEGVHWENVDGVSQPTEAYLEQMKTDPDYRTKSGVTLYNKMSGFKETQILSDGYPADLMKANEQKSTNLLDIDRSYIEYYSEKFGQDFSYPGEVLNYLCEQGEVNTINEYILYPDLAQQPDSDTVSIIQQCDQYMNTQGIKAIMAEDDAEFDAIREEAMTQLENIGILEVNAIIVEIYESAKEQASSFVIE